MEQGITLGGRLRRGRNSVCQVRILVKLINIILLLCFFLIWSPKETKLLIKCKKEIINVFSQ